jgi:hypothetical protein
VSPHTEYFLRRAVAVRRRKIGISRNVAALDTQPTWPVPTTAETTLPASGMLPLYNRRKPKAGRALFLEADPPGSEGGMRAFAIAMIRLDYAIQAKIAAGVLANMLWLFQKFVRLDLQNLCKSFDYINGRAAFLSFDQPDIGTRHPRFQS